MRRVLPLAAGSDRHRLETSRVVSAPDLVDELHEERELGLLAGLAASRVADRVTTGSVEDLDLGDVTTAGSVPRGSESFDRRTELRIPECLSQSLLIFWSKGSRPVALATEYVADGPVVEEKQTAAHEANGMYDPEDVVMRVHHRSPCASGVRDQEADEQCSSHQRR